MKKVLLMTYLYFMYVLATPLLLVGAIGTITYISINSKKDFGSYEIKEYTRALISGFITGHKHNILAIKQACGEEVEIEDWI